MSPLSIPNDLWCPLWAPPYPQLITELQNGITHVISFIDRVQVVIGLEGQSWPALDFIYRAPDSPEHAQIDDLVAEIHAAMPSGRMRDIPLGSKLNPTGYWPISTRVSMPGEYRYLKFFRKVSLSQPTVQNLQVIHAILESSGLPYRVTAVEITVDYIVKDIHILTGLRDLFKFSVHPYCRDRRGTDLSWGKTEYPVGYRASSRPVRYPDRPSKPLLLDGHGHCHCYHVEWREFGSGHLRDIGIADLADLAAFDVGQFVAKKLRMAYLDPVSFPYAYTWERSQGRRKFNLQLLRHADKSLHDHGFDRVHDVIAWFKRLGVDNRLSPTNVRRFDRPSPGVEPIDIDWLIPRPGERW
ncbi:MAG: hypothetical protein HQL56_03510 [Magnetococcales bacterium]|nr:hypothetical protein [Magnetococcales bacterium]